MKDYVLELAARQTGYNTKLNTMREYLDMNIFTQKNLLKLIKGE